MADRTHNKIENSRNGRHSDRLVYEFNLQECEERANLSFDNFTETLTKKLVQQIVETPSLVNNIHIIFRYTSEGSVWTVNGKWWAHAVHDFAKKFKIPLKNITFISASATIEETYNRWHKLYAPNDDKINCEYENFGFWYIW